MKLQLNKITIRITSNHYFWCWQSVSPGQILGENTIVIFYCIGTLKKKKTTGTERGRMLRNMKGSGKMSH